jgi:hypothetical protein
MDRPIYREDVQKQYTSTFSNKVGIKRMVNDNNTGNTKIIL